jgi:rhamnogalacturonan endolyase
MNQGIIDYHFIKHRRWLMKQVFAGIIAILVLCNFAYSDAQSYLRIPLQGDYDFQKIGIADLDGDGELDYIIKQPNFNTDPYQKPGYWKPSTTTYKLEAYKKNGTHLWTYDMGWAIEAGIWYSPWVVYDVDGDGKAEVYCKAGEGDPRTEKGHVESGPEYLVKIDGQTGEVVAKTDWISREGYPSYNFYCRNFLAIAYLDGKKPSLIMQRGTYNVIKTWALDSDFQILWKREILERNKEKSQNHYGQGSHGLIAADVDNDGKDELVIGSSVIDDNGESLWTTGMGHPDICYCADIDPDNPGLEIFYGYESPQNTDGMCVVDAKTGKKLWGLKEKTYHLHGQGMCADILAEYPGMEVFAGERDYEKRWLYSATGTLIKFFESKITLTPRPIWWDADPQKEVVMNGGIGDWGKEPMMKYEGKPILVVDCMGDWREELITAVKGEIRIYTSPIPCDIQRPALLSDRQYRLGIANQTMGYYYPAQVSLNYPF